MYHKQTVNLSAYSGRNAKIRWRDVSDESLEAMGTALDDVEITGLPHMNTGTKNIEQFSEENFELLSNYPNPFNPATTIQYRVAASSKITIRIYDVLGNTVATLTDEIKNKGSYSVQWHAQGCPSGIYFCEMQRLKKYWQDTIMYGNGLIPICGTVMQIFSSQVIAKSYNLTPALSFVRRGSRNSLLLKMLQALVTCNMSCGLISV
ncbi:MAG: T9SS type A sorting domain-containing protein [Ignavibacteriales bacterium]|nr:T9SS type A sorting domain-containing protein [Ignavibacteriales bacterium]